MNCPKCGTECCRDEVGVGVGVIHGPYGCPGCAWSESEEYDLSTGKNPVDERGGMIDQYGGYHPPTDLVEALRNPLLVTDERFDLTRKAADELERLRAGLNCDPDICVSRIAEREAEIERLRAALQRIADDDVDPDLRGRPAILSGIAWAALAGKVQP